MAISAAPVPEHALMVDPANCLWSAPDSTGSLAAFPSLSSCLTSQSGRDLGYQSCSLRVLVADASCSKQGTFEAPITGMQREVTATDQNAYSHDCPLKFSFRGNFSLFPMVHSSHCLIYYFYSCPLHHTTPVPQKTSELQANQNIEFALS